MSPKLHKDFEITLNFGHTLAMKQALTAVGYFSSSKGEYAGAARNLLERGYKSWLATLTEKERKEFDEILERCKLIVTK